MTSNEKRPDREIRLRAKASVPYTGHTRYKTTKTGTFRFGIAPDHRLYTVDDLALGHDSTVLAVVSIQELAWGAERQRKGGDQGEPVVHDVAAYDALL